MREAGAAVEAEKRQLAGCLPLADDPVPRLEPAEGKPPLACGDGRAHTRETNSATAATQEIDPARWLNPRMVGKAEAGRPKPGRVTVAGKRSDDLHPKTAASILRQAGLRQ